MPTTIQSRDLITRGSPTAGALSFALDTKGLRPRDKLTLMVIAAYSGRVSFDQLTEEVWGEIDAQTVTKTSHSVTTLHQFGLIDDEILHHIAETAQGGLL